MYIYIAHYIECFMIMSDVDLIYEEFLSNRVMPHRIFLANFYRRRTDRLWQKCLSSAQTHWQEPAEPWQKIDNLFKNYGLLKTAFTSPIQIV